MLCTYSGRLKVVFMFGSFFVQGKFTLPKLFIRTKTESYLMEKIKTQISLFELPAEQFRVKLDKSFRKALFKHLLERFGSFSEIAKQTGLKRGNCVRRYYIERSGMPLIFLIKVSELIGVSEIEIQKHVIELKTMKSKVGIKNPKLPIDLSKSAFGLVVGGVLGDGGIEKRKCRVWYFNKEKQQIESFTKAVIECFGDVKFAWHRSIGGTPCIIFPKAIGLILKETGLIDGNKNYAVNLGIPKMILNSKNELLKISVLQRLFDDDGTVSNHHNNRCVSFVSPIIYETQANLYQKPKVLLDIQSILSKFGIVSKIVAYCKNLKKNGEVTVRWEIRIHGKQNLQKFYDKIGFGLERKQSKLKTVLERYVNGLEFFPRFKASKIYLEKIALLQKQNVSVTSTSLAKCCDRNARHIREILLDLFKKGLIFRKLIGNKYVYGVN